MRPPNARNLSRAGLGFGGGWFCLAVVIWWLGRDGLRRGDGELVGDVSRGQLGGGLSGWEVEQGPFGRPWAGPAGDVLGDQTSGQVTGDQLGAGLGVPGRGRDRVLDLDGKALNRRCRRPVASSTSSTKPGGTCRTSTPAPIPLSTGPCWRTNPHP